MLQSPKGSGLIPSACQPMAWASSDSQRIVPVEKSNSVTIGRYICQAEWPFSYGPAANAAIVVPVRASSPPFSHFSLPWKNFSYTWPLIPQSLPGPVILPPPTGVRFPILPHDGLQQPCGISILPSVSRPRSRATDVPTTADSTDLAPLASPCYPTGVPSEVASNGRSEQANVKTASTGQGKAESSFRGGAPDEEDGHADDEGSGLYTGICGRCDCVYVQQSCSCRQELQQSETISPNYVPSIQIAPAPSQPAHAQHGMRLSLGSNADSNRIFLPPGTLHYPPAGQAPPAVQYCSSDHDKSRAIHRHLLQVQDSAAARVKKDISLAFNVTKDQVGLERGCSVCGTLSCGSRPTNRGDGSPPRRQYFSCKVARRRLLEWIELHKEHPYPTKAERTQLIKKTGMTRVQLQNWFGNQRRRLNACRRADRQETELGRFQTDE